MLMLVGGIIIPGCIGGGSGMLPLPMGGGGGGGNDGGRGGGGGLLMVGLELGFLCGRRSRYGKEVERSSTARTLPPDDCWSVFVRFLAATLPPPVVPAQPRTTCIACNSNSMQHLRGQVITRN